MSKRCNIISFGKINKYYFLIMLSTISYICVNSLEKQSKIFLMKINIQLYYFLLIHLVYVYHFY